MDEYLNDDGSYIDIESPPSFRGFMRRTVYTKIDPELIMPEEQRVFPSHKLFHHQPSKVRDFFFSSQASLLRSVVKL